jgi:hypothetical protein
MKIKQMEANTTNIEFLKALKKITFFMPYNVNDETLEAWGKFINEIEPKITTDILNKMMVKFSNGEAVVDKNIGIKNIFIGFICVLKDMMKGLPESEKLTELRHTAYKYKNLYNSEKI